MSSLPVVDVTGPLLDVRDLKVHIDTDEGVLPAVDAVSIVVGAGERVGLVGESGCGKSMVTRSILQLFPPMTLTEFSGSVRFAGRDVMQMSVDELRDVRRRQIGIVFQDPMTYLNPTMRIDKQVAERLPKGVSKEERNSRVELALTRAGLEPDRVKRRFPHELSGGMRQRVLIAIALVGDAPLIIADEPTTALDVSVQARIMDTLAKLTEDAQTSVLLVTHDLAVVANFCQRVYVMYAGKIVEEGPVESIFLDPKHPYTQGLLSSIPSATLAGRELTAIEGSVPDLRHLPAGCSFAPRCPMAMARCSEPPPWISGPSGGALCWLLDPDVAGREDGA